MNMKMIWINIIILSLMTACSSASNSGANKKTCTIVKHQFDYLFQVKINKDPISEQWFLKEDAEGIASDLSKKNRCLYKN